MFEIRKNSASAMACAALIGTIASCGAGGSSGSVAPISFEFASSTASTGEGAGTATIDVRLVLTIDQLEEAASVEIFDAGSGSAAPGSDYQPFTTQTLTFPAGSTDGATQSINLTSLGDSAFEGTETVNLQLSNPSSGSGLGTIPTITVEINESQSSSVQFQVASATSASEAAAPLSIAVELGLAPGIVLDNDLTVDVADTGAGSALAFFDYSVLTQTLTFPAGSMNGTIREVTLSVLADSTMEGDETVILELRDPGLDATLGTNATFTYTITDDDISATPFFSATANGLGTLNNGQAVDLGNQQVNTGPNFGVSLNVANLGTQAMSLYTPSLSGVNAGDFRVEASIGAAPAATANSPEVMASPIVPLFEHPTEGVELVLDAAILDPLKEASSVLLVAFPLPGGETCDLELERVRSPWAGDAVLYHNGQPVSGGPDSLCPDLSIWKGAIAGDEDSSAFLSFSEHGCRGWIRTSEAADDIIHLVTDFDDSGPERVQRSRLIHPQQMILAGANQTAPSSVCGGALLPPGEEDPAGMILSQATTAGLTLSDCRIAVETDYQFYQEFNDAAAATAYATQLFAAVSDVYLRDIQTTLSVAYLGIYSTSSDPWSTPDTLGSTGDLLDEFRTAWAGAWPVQADLAHFLSGASLGGGIAYVNVLCNNSFGFGVSASLNGNIDWGAWTGQSNFINWDFVVVAHEIGHNFSASHTHNYCPPLDQCSAANCNGSKICSRGTIMSYCHTCSGGLSNIDLEFHPQIANQMRGAVNTSCLGQANLGSGESLDYQVRFYPTSSTGSKSASLNIGHTATNVTSPFILNLSGQATN